METNKFDQWAIVEIMGHQRYAGRVTEQAIGGSNFVRVDVPETTGKPGFTKMFGASAIYALTIVDEETARAAVQNFNQQPLDAWSARKMLDTMEKSGKPVLLVPFAESNSEDESGSRHDY